MHTTDPTPPPSYNGTGIMLGRKKGYEGGRNNMMPLTRLPEGQQWKVNWIPDPPPDQWGGGDFRFPSSHKQYEPIGLTPEQTNIITPQKVNQTPTMIQVKPPTTWMNETWRLISSDPSKTNARNFQSPGTNEGSSLLITMVSKQMQEVMNTTRTDGLPNKIDGTHLMYHSTPILLKALKNNEELKELHYTITTNQYPAPIESELCPAAASTLYQNTKHPYTAMDDVDLLTPQEIDTIITTFCERFYPQITKKDISNLTINTEEEITRALRTPGGLSHMLKETGAQPKFEPPFISIIRHETKPITQTNYDPIDIIGSDIQTFKLKSTNEKIQTVLDNIQVLLQDRVEPTQIYRATDLIKKFNTEEINNMMTPSGFQKFTQGLHAKPTTFRFGRHSHGSNIEYDYTLRILHVGSYQNNEIGWKNYPGAVLREYLCILGPMTSFFGHTATLNPTPSNKELQKIPISEITEDTPDETLEKYVYNKTLTRDASSIQSFDIFITSSYSELGRPGRQQTIEGNEARNYAQSLHRNEFAIKRLDRMVHGNPPCIMLANSIRGEDDHRIKAEIMSRLHTSDIKIPTEEIDVLWTTVYSPNAGAKVTAKCITLPQGSHPQIPQVIQAINTQRNKTKYPLTYNYNATPLTPPNGEIDRIIEAQTQYTRTITSISLTGLNEIDIYSTPITDVVGGPPTTIVQQILTATYTSTDGITAPSPVIKISMSENRGRYNLFASKSNAHALIEFTPYLLKMIPQWLQGNRNYTGAEIRADTSAAQSAIRYLRKTHREEPPTHALNTTANNPPNNQTQLVSHQTTNPPSIDHTRSKQEAGPSTDLNAYPQTQSPKTSGTDMSEIPQAILQLSHQISTLQTALESQTAIITQLLQDSNTAKTMTSTLPTQITESIITRVDSSISTVSEMQKTYTDESSSRLTTQFKELHNTQQEIYNKILDEHNKKFGILFDNLAEIGNSYNGVATSYGRCVHGVGNELLLHRATAARMTNQIEFIINNIAKKPEFLEGEGLFEAYQEHISKWETIEAGIYDEYIRGEGTLSPRTQKLKWSEEYKNYTEDHNQTDNYYNPTPPRTPTQEDNTTNDYKTPEKVTVDLTDADNSPGPNNNNDIPAHTPQKQEANPTISHPQNHKTTHSKPSTGGKPKLEASYASTFYPEERLAQEEQYNTSTCNECNLEGQYLDFTHCNECYTELHIKCAVETEFNILCKKCSQEHTKPLATPKSHGTMRMNKELGTSERGTCNTCLKTGVYGDDFTVCRECYCDVCKGCSRKYNEIVICLQCRREKTQHSSERECTTDGTYSESTTMAHTTSEEFDEEVKDDLNDDDLKKLLRHETKPPHNTTPPTPKPTKRPTPDEATDTPDDGWHTAKPKKSLRAQEPAARDDNDKPQKLLSPNGTRKSTRLRTSAPKTN